MEWIKVTPETMPKKGTVVFAVVRYKCYGKWYRSVWPDVMLSENGGWEYLADSTGEHYKPIDEMFEECDVTHWMKYPRLPHE